MFSMMFDPLRKVNQVKIQYQSHIRTDMNVAHGKTSSPFKVCHSPLCFACSDAHVLSSCREKIDKLRIPNDELYMERIGQKLTPL